MFIPLSKYHKFSFFLIALFAVVFITGCSATKKKINKISGNDPIPEDMKKPVSVPITSEPKAQLNPSPVYAGSSSLLVKKDPRSNTVLDYSEALRKLAKKFASTFPQVEGYIVSVKGRELFLDLKYGDNIADGNIMTVFREGEEFRHPLSGEVLGRFEEEIGKIEITRITEKYSNARVVSELKGKKVEVGDKVRITATRIKIAVLPFVNKSKQDLDTDTITEEMVNALKETQRFEIYDKDKFQVALLENNIDIKNFLPSRDLVRIKQIASSDFLLVNITRDLKGKQVVDSEIFSLKDHSSIFATNAIVKELPTRMASMGMPPATYQPRFSTGQTRSWQQTSPVNPQFILQEQGKYIFQQEGLWKSRIFQSEIRNIAIGDVNGDGLKEVVIIFRNRLEVYQAQGSKLQRIYSYTEKRTDGFISLDVADINKNGVDEIYISNISGEFLKSFVIENKGGRFKKIAKDLPLFLRVFKPYRKEPFLIGQPMGTASLFSKYMYHYTWNRNKLKRGNELGIPFTVTRTVYGFVLDDINRDGKEDILMIDNDDHLRLYTRKGDLKWMSREYYGGYSISFADKGSGSWDISKPTDPIGLENMVSIKGRILIYDTDRDGLGEVIIQRNVPTTYKALAGLTGYNDSQMVNMIWDTAGLIEVWRAKNANGAINDFAIGDIDNDGMDELVAVLAFQKGTLDLKEKESMIIVYDMG